MVWLLMGSRCAMITGSAMQWRITMSTPRYLHLRCVVWLFRLPLTCGCEVVIDLEIWLLHHLPRKKASS